MTGKHQIPLEITVRTAVGEGRTLLSAFDTALLGAGVADFNLIPLSSVIPPRAVVSRTSETLPGEHGDRLYCVESVAYADHPGEIVSAGLGWAIHPEVGGLFVEHTGGSEASVDEQIRLSLADMAANRGIDFGEVHTAIVSAHCTTRPVCALAIAAYEVAGWGRP
ncbi:pyruvoyl-dependent arginine decarboxylase [Nocardioides sp. 1609]|uniref:pyruvoyl-dependent arginine decarboxylase n=1 Tax=Nocardioides sp. 1609 TaxID=2508327 RepID=UPI00106F391A|nr:pyruvoyl-dependent arginine decarboxylase [Nocardioides sp. 1609]